ncbi:Uncharacterised protein [Shigella dysenteriae]|uniref:Uncharacterized protein n=1 Tax=Shigella dysenteriae TaxID=622 RepID=A0A2X2KT37_SHIDY|nr:Uncharacterised protein [Shigella dysenteriae]
MSVHLFEFLLFLIVTHFEYMSSGVALLESLYVLVVVHFEFLLVSHFAPRTETDTT